ncbi:IgGFc-binding protein [Scomber scombrus]
MCPVWFVFLLLAALKPESIAAVHENNTGLNFIAVFPENIAYYHPSHPQNQVQITALYDNTQVIIKQSSYDTSYLTLTAAEKRDIILGKKLEMRKQDISDRTLQITSTKIITVHAISLKDNSVQTALVIPTDKLGTEYFIPPIPTIQGTTDSDMVTTSVTEKGPFRIIVVNADQDNKITVEGAMPSEVLLQPYQNTQILLNADAALRTVKTDQPAAVLFGHTCAMRHNCSCGMLYTLLPPAEKKKLNYFIPPVLAKDAEAETFVLLSEGKSTKVEAFNPKSPLVRTSGTAVLYRPGLLLTLIPETDFGSCYAVNFISNMINRAVIIVHKDFIYGIHVQHLPLESPEWETLKGTEFVSTHITLLSGKTIIWHSHSKMAVYFLGQKDSTLFGNPAAMISKTPDFRGCAVIPEVVQIGEEAASWQESLKYCKDNNMELVSISEAKLQEQIKEKIMQANNDNLREVWIGMRRSSLNGEWYWLNKDTVESTNWDEGEPGTVQDGQCVSMSLETGKNFVWSDKDCCHAARPVCYSSPVLLPMYWS